MSDVASMPGAQANPHLLGQEADASSLVSGQLIVSKNHNTNRNSCFQLCAGEQGGCGGDFNCFCLALPIRSSSLHARGAEECERPASLGAQSSQFLC